MGLSLTGKSIAACTTLEDIRAEILLIKAAIRTAREAKADSLNDMQASQKTERQSLKDLNEELRAYCDAEAILTGHPSSYATIESGNYTGAPKI
jgi:hypothetical protein